MTVKGVEWSRNEQAERLKRLNFYDNSHNLLKRLLLDDQISISG